jgi:Fe-S oxidoreductase
MVKFNLFVLPFCIGIAFLVVFLVVRFTGWIKKLSEDDQLRFRKGIFSVKLFSAAREIVMESLLHRRIFMRNIVLGYMHMSFAFGWFMLILIGNIEARFYARTEVNPPYYPIFLKFFVHDKSSIPGSMIFTFLMDFFLLLVLSGLVLAMIKRFFSSAFGMKKTTKLKLADKVALFALWFIFPCRLIAESVSSELYHSGGFLTGSVGYIIGSLFPAENLLFPAWWAYSFALGLFFVFVPWTRYMHIPSEIVLILMRHFGIRNTISNKGFTQAEIYSCSRCGICLDQCQLATIAGYRSPQPSYFFQSIRNKSTNDLDRHNCLLCGRCEEACPVNIDIVTQRIFSRKVTKGIAGSDFHYLKNENIKSAKVAYFAGCMGHLTPSVIKSMKTIFKESGTEFTMIDADGSVCCGRPLMMSGEIDSAKQLMKHNEELINNSGATMLVTSCPICYKVFREDYTLSVNVFHHSEYINSLIKKGKIEVEKTSRIYAYHDPCELGRGSNIYKEPREIIKQLGNLYSGNIEGEEALCCGGSLGNLLLKSEERRIIAFDAVSHLVGGVAEELITACPLCKKTFTQVSTVEVKDIAEIVASSIVKNRTTDAPLRFAAQVHSI